MVVRILVILADVFLLVTPPAQRDRRISHHHQSEFRVIVSRVVSNEYPRIVAGAGRCRPAGRGGGAVCVRVCRDSTDLFATTVSQCYNRFSKTLSTNESHSSPQSLLLTYCSNESSFTANAGVTPRTFAARGALGST